MTGGNSGTLARGTRLASDSGLWEVAEISGDGLLLRDALGRTRRMGAGRGSRR